MILIALVIILNIIIAAEGNQRIVNVSDDSELISDSVLPNDKDDSNFVCCVHGNCSCNSLDIALARLTSNVLIYIITDVTLSSSIKVSDLKNISIIGCNKPTVNCRNIGGIHLTFCHNCIFKGITWDECGNNTNDGETEPVPGLKLSYSHDIVIQNCLFQHSIGPIVLLLVSNNVKISHCNFLNNRDVCVYAINQHLYFDGKILFQNNTAKNGSGIYISDHSAVIFNKNSDVTFIQNSALRGGAIFLRNNSSLIFDQNCTAMFNNNYADRGAIYSEASSNVIFTASCKVIFNNNLCVAIYSSYKSDITFTENSFVTFSNNQNLHKYTIYLYEYCYIRFKGNSFTIFYNNTGGGMFTYKGNISFEENSTTEFFDNYSHNSGGAMYTDKSTMYFKENSTTKFSNNIAVAFGGAIYCDKSYIYFRKSSTAIFNNNTAYYAGGAISLSLAITFFEGESFILFYKNSARNIGGGAIHTFYSSISFEKKSITNFYRNFANDYGGAVFTELKSAIRFSDNSTVKFAKNKATSGAIVYSSNTCTIKATGDPRIIINDFLAKWCTNGCMTYTDRSNNGVSIDNNGIVWCSNNNAFTCISKNCHCKNLEDILDATTDVLIAQITDTVLLSSFISLKNIKAVTIIGHNKLTVLCINGGGISLRNFSSLRFEGITWMGCGDFSAFNDQALLNIYESTNVTITNCSFQNSAGIAIKLHDMIGNANISNCNFTNNNQFRGHGSCITYANTILKENYPLTINNCNFSFNGPAKSVIYMKIIGNRTPISHIYIISSKFYNNIGVSIYLPFMFATMRIVIHITGKVLFKNNVTKNGVCVYSIGHVITFDEGSDVKVINNSAKQSGAAIFTSMNSFIIFENYSRVDFINNKATNGTIYSDKNSRVIFAATSQVTFSGNSVTQYGAAIYSSDDSYIIFTGSSQVTFNNNMVASNSKDLQVGGIILSKNFAHVLFAGDSVTTFTNNSADFGAAILSFYISTVSFKDRSSVIFNNNKAHYCGVLVSALHSSIDFNENATIIYNNNTASGILNGNHHYESSESAGTICAYIGAEIKFSGHSQTIFINNRALRGGVAVLSESNVIIEENVKVIINNNVAEYLHGGAIVCLKNSSVSLKDSSKTIFHSNQASQDAGVIYNCKITFKDNSVAEFINNSAGAKGGAIAISKQYHDNTITFEGNTKVTFDSNRADYGGAFFITNSTIIFKGSSMVLFSNNTAKRKGGVGYFSLNSNVLFEGLTAVKFHNNVAEQNAGVIYTTHSYISFTANSRLTFAQNKATLNGGALHFDSNSNVIFSQFTNIKFCSNIGSNGGAILANDHSNITLAGNSMLLFANNSANQYGGAIFLEVTAVMIINCNSKNCINFKDNIAYILGDCLYQNVPKLCYNNCSNDKVVGISNKFISTPPKELKLNQPASAICFDKDTTQCNYYYIQNIMLGMKFVVPACVFDYYNHSVYNTQFLLQSEINPNYFITGPTQVLISCDAFEGFSIIGNQSVTKSMNFSINITLNTIFNPSWKPISVNLMIELSPCHLGFWQHPKSPKCECYDANDIVFCSDTSSTIKRGYWFGSVTGKPTVTFCPINYCNFTCCETSNGYYQLSPVRDDQCRSHRTGTACGKCTTGYTLSFDSPECVKVESCTARKTALVILLALLYWIIIVAIAFAMMYNKVGICYMYSITYYYSIVDILLNQNLQDSRGLNSAINILSSFSKIIPKFLGELCLTTGMSGIDQQFIHYIHPLAIIVILVAITLLARRSKIISNIIRRGIIHVICLLLLLSYTSMASTSLLLMRPLKFHDIDKVYTYLSPDIEYFHGRHLAYSIVALLCAIFIVIGLPLLLILEPFLNHRINFIKIKPLLDQFQGSYKDKCRCFAGYYMICRLAIIIIVIINSSNDSITSYALITVCGTIALIHLMIKPYANNEILNRFDGVILQLIIFIAALQLPENLESLSVTFVLITLPLLMFIVMIFYLNRYNLKKIITYFINKILSTSNDGDRIIDYGVNNESELREFNTITVDDSQRKNAIICDV